MKVLTLHQPWASLVALGVKTIETRSWSTQYRGPLAIHAGSSKVGATQCSECWDAIYREYDRENELPLGAIVATCTLVDVVPIVADPGIGASMLDLPIPCAAVLPPSTLSVLRGPGRIAQGASEQIPYGDFTLGRYAWLLADVVPLDPPVPFKGGQGLTKTWEP